MTRKLLVALAIMLAVVSLSSCTKKGKSDKPRSIGNTSEILVIVESEKQWDNGIGKVIRETFAKDQYGLPQAEPLFKLSHVQKKSFSDLFQKHHNLFIVEIDPKIKEPKIETSKNLWSEPQRIFKVIAPSSKDFVEIVSKNKKTFIDAFNQSDRERIMNVFRPVQNAEAVTEIRKATGVKMVVPKDFYLAKNLEGFVWVRKEAVDLSQSVIIISADYIDTAQFSTESIMARTNRALKENVPGAVFESYMTTDDKFVPPVKNIVDDFPAGFAVEISGMWKVENDFMGGPFKSYTLYNEKTGKIITFFGYVYKPNQNKRDILKQVETLIYSVEI